MWPFSSDPEHISIIGLDAAGKTTLLYRLKLNENITTIPTIGVNVETVTLGGHGYTMWDIGGRDKTRWLFLKTYSEKAHAIVWVVDSNDRDRLDTAAAEVHRLLTEDANMRKKNLPVLVVCNKQDVPGALTPEEIEGQIDPKDWIQNRPVRWVGCSAVDPTAKDLKALHAGFQWLARQVGTQSPLGRYLQNVAFVAGDLRNRINAALSFASHWTKNLWGGTPFKGLKGAVASSKPTATTAASAAPAVAVATEAPPRSNDTEKGRDNDNVVDASEYSTVVNSTLDETTLSLDVTSSRSDKFGALSNTDSPRDVSDASDSSSSSDGADNPLSSDTPSVDPLASIHLRAGQDPGSLLPVEVGGVDFSM
eukprot:Rmarinus@m.4854